jgi:tripartite-type tricarboxylate transporter receptor subunit TctC
MKFSIFNRGLARLRKISVMQIKEGGIMKKAATAIALGMLVCGWSGQQVYAQAERPYPTRQVNYMICFDPGGQSDRVARMQQPHLEKILGQKVLIDYKVGGGGSLGWRELTRGTRRIPDGRIQYSPCHSAAPAAGGGI